MYRDGRGRILNHLNCCPHGSLNDDFVTNLMTLFCVRKILMASENPPQIMIPYEMWD